MTTNKEIIKFLMSRNISSGFIDRLKIKFRPLICPFDDLLKFSETANSVLDIGCGSGQFCALLANFTGVKKIEGIEINQTLLNNAKRLHAEFDGKKDISFSLFDGSNFPDNVSEFDLIYLIDILHHIPLADQPVFLSNLYTKMKKGSKLILKDMDAGTILVYFNKFHDFVFSGEIGNEISFIKAQNIISGLGFHISSAFKKRIWTYAHYFIICSKE